MSIAALPKSSCSTTHFRYEKGFYKIRCGVVEQRACIYSGAPNDCFLWNIWIFYSLRKARNFYMTVPVVYNFGSLSNKITTTLPRCRLGGFLVISFIFSIRFCFTFFFRSFIRSERLKFIRWKEYFYFGQQVLLFAT